MNAKIQKLRDELEKQQQKLTRIQSRVDELTRKLTELENTEIVGMVQATGLTLDQLAALLPKLKENPIPRPEKEATESEE